MSASTHPITPAGYKALSDELDFLRLKERPKIVEIVSWAAGNGDRSENGDYIYNKKRLREIDRRMRYLVKKLENARIVDPKDQQGQTRIFFGAVVTYIREDETEVTVHLVDVDETELPSPEGVQRINWHAPVGRALLKAEVGDDVTVRTEAGSEILEVVKVEYPLER